MQILCNIFKSIIVECIHSLLLSTPLYIIPLPFYLNCMVLANTMLQFADIHGCSSVSMLPFVRGDTDPQASCNGVIWREGGSEEGGMGFHCPVRPYFD